ncbi:FAD-binding oxidoreductase [Pseudorhodoferax sp. Leaf265]|uniref:FAD-binding oxidoreductase n=1 Tax=Pseudorhodoferax sp. Leaf265 TaxID=1736315 RepID=UPI000701D94B|nr:FAD-binding protein [Pseudorhodoferax sp. Leaf265]
MTSLASQFPQQLPHLDWITDAMKVGRLSQDFFWFSPVLKRQLMGKRAESVVRPRNEEEIKQVVAACAKAQVPLTVRGAGTGNYGQSVPLDGGVVMDLSACSRSLWQRPGVARAQAGIRLTDLNRELIEGSKQELRWLPSTYRSATLGGLFAGGFGGAGSVTYGPLAAPGNILGVKAVTVEEEPQIVELRGPEALLLHHMWGTNGIVLEVEFAVAPALDWLESIAVFETFESALQFANGLAQSPGIAKKEVALLADPIPAYMTTLKEYLPEGLHAVLLVHAASAEPIVGQMAAANGGRITYRVTQAEALASNHTLIEHAWNHTTLHALKVDKTLTYLQTAFVPGKHLEQVMNIRAMFGDEVLLHLEFIRTADGQSTCTALPLVRFTTEERLNEIMAMHRAAGVRVNNPHTFVIEEGKQGGNLSAAQLDMKRRLDPLGLLNPGKMRAWPQRGAMVISSTPAQEPA